MHKSEVARFREQQAFQEEAARLALHGPALTARHAFITARMEQAAERILRLFHEGKGQEAITLMAMPLWGREEDTTTSQADEPEKLGEKEEEGKNGE